MQSKADPAAAPRRQPALKGEDAEQQNLPSPAYSGNKERDPHFRPGRALMSNVTGYFPPEVKKQLRIMAAEGSTTIQELLAEALNDLFAKRGRPEIAPREDGSKARGGRRPYTGSGDTMQASA